MLSNFFEKKTKSTLFNTYIWDHTIAITLAPPLNWYFKNISGPGVKIQAWWGERDTQKWLKQLVTF